jgi:SynChlorMet cassette radical SAM/SPASM protein ScmE
MRSPRSVDLEITSRCNLRCRYCYFFGNPDVTYRDLPTDEWLRFFAELGAAHVMKVCFCGGEPFMREDLPQLIDGVVCNRMRFSLVSNGGLIDDDKADFMAKTGRCDYVQVSIDGSKAEVHDAFRGEGSFAGAVRGVRTLQRHGLKVDVRLTVHRRNVEDLEAAARFLLEELNLPAFSTNSAGYLGFCRQNADEVLLTVSQREQAMRVQLAVERKYPGRINAQAGPLADGQMWAEMIQADSDHNAGGCLTSCGGCNSTLAVRSDGTMVPCTMLPHLGLGRINRDPLVETWQNHPLLRRLRERASIQLSGFAECRGCSFISRCNGGCPGLAYTLTGEVDRPSTDSCLRQYLETGGTLPERP